MWSVRAAQVVGVARTPRPEENVQGLDAVPGLLPTADGVILLCPLTDSTRGLVNADFLGRMKEGAVLVNAARCGAGLAGARDPGAREQHRIAAAAKRCRRSKWVWYR